MSKLVNKLNKDNSTQKKRRYRRKIKRSPKQLSRVLNLALLDFIDILIEKDRIIVRKLH